MRLCIDAREDPRTLGLMRIGIGLCALGDIASLIPHVAYLFGDAGVAPATSSCGGSLQHISLLCAFPGEDAALLILGLGSAAALALDVLDANGDRHPAFDDRGLIGERRYPYVFIDRRQKMHGRIIGRERWQIAHADYLCRTWRDSDGRPPTAVELRRRTGPTPSSDELATIPLGEEAAAIDAAARDDLLVHRRCEQDGR